MKRLFAVSLLAATPALNLSAQSSRKANVLFIFADDQTFESIGSLNNHEIKTPNLDQLKDIGISFNFAFNTPHDPRQSPKEYVDMYPLENNSVPESFLPEYPNCEEAGSGPKLRDERLAPFPRTEYTVRVNRQEYYAIITHMDA